MYLCEARNLSSDEVREADGVLRRDAREMRDRAVERHREHLPVVVCAPARPVHLIITMIKWIRTSRFRERLTVVVCASVDGSEEGSYLRLIDLCITQLQA